MKKILVKMEAHVHDRSMTTLVPVHLDTVASCVKVKTLLKTDDLHAIFVTHILYAF